MGTIDSGGLRSESIISLAGAFCGGLFLGVVALAFASFLPPPLPFGAVFAAVSGCAEFVKLLIRRRTSGEAAALAVADAIGLLAGFGVAQALSWLAP